MAGLYNIGIFGPEGTFTAEEEGGGAADWWERREKSWEEKLRLDDKQSKISQIGISMWKNYENEEIQNLFLQDNTMLLCYRSSKVLHIQKHILLSWMTNWTLNRTIIGLISNYIVEYLLLKSLHMISFIFYPDRPLYQSQYIRSLKPIFSNVTLDFTFSKSAK